MHRTIDRLTRHTAEVVEIGGQTLRYTHPETWRDANQIGWDLVAMNRAGQLANLRPGRGIFIR